MIRIDTPDDVARARAALTPTFITSRSAGRVLVPCGSTVLVRPTLIVANTWNPNHVPEEKLELLRQSILDNGFTFPIVAIWDEAMGKFVVIDGFHRTLIGGGDWLDFDYLPVVILDHDISRRMTATMQFNKARGHHQVDLDAEVIRALIEQGMGEEEIATKLGMDLDTIHRYKQLTGVAALFAKADYSGAWEMVDDGDGLAP